MGKAVTAAAPAAPIFPAPFFRAHRDHRARLPPTSLECKAISLPLPLDALLNREREFDVGKYFGGAKKAAGKKGKTAAANEGGGSAGGTAAAAAAGGKADVKTGGGA